MSANLPARSIVGLVALALASVRTVASAQQPEALWYMTDNEASVQSFLAHADQISIASPQVFSMDSLGVIWGGVDARVVAKARSAGVKLIPLVVNPGFDQSTIHRVLTLPDVRARAIRNLADLCREQGFDGIQFDFENINIADRDAFSSFARASADALHHVGCSLSAAVVPRTSDFPGPTQFHRWIFENWRGAYDYAALASSLDFISFMTYAQHTGGTTPGPVAGFVWMENALRFLLSLGVPAQKISLGIPSYSDWWYPTFDVRPGIGERMVGGDISYATAKGILARHAVQPIWDERQKSAYAFWEDDGVNEFLFLEDARSFVAKMSLVSKYKLRGYSVWVLGTEDPATWPALRGAR